MKRILKNVIKGIVLLFIVLVVIGMFIPSQDFALTTDQLVLEYGETLPKSFDDFIETDGDKKNIDYSSQDIDDFNKVLEVGTYSIDFQSGGKTETLKVEVKDTVKPILTLKEPVNVLQNNNIDYSQYIDVQDKSQYKTIIEDDQVDYATPGKYQAKVIAQDLYGNEAHIDIPVNIEEVTLKPSVTSIKLNKDASQVLQVETNSPHDIVYKSSNDTIASVDAKGNVKALKAGHAIIHASVDGKTTSCQVTVNDPNTDKPIRENNTSNKNSTNSKKSNSTSNKSTSSKKSSSTKSSSQKNNTTKQNNVSSTVYITKTGNKYHEAGCRYLRKSKIAISKSKAISQGYEACSVCH